MSPSASATPQVAPPGRAPATFIRYVYQLIQYHNGDCVFTVLIRYLWLFDEMTEQIGILSVDMYYISLVGCLEKFGYSEFRQLSIKHK